MTSQHTPGPLASATASGGASAGALVGDAAERVILVDADDRETGIAPKLLAHHEGLRHRAFSVFVRDPQGRQLLQRRAAVKYHSGGLWSNTCCGHPRPGEGLAEAAGRRLYEELGFTCALRPLGRLHYAVDFGNGLHENEVVTLFAGVHAGAVRPNPDEVDAVTWMDEPALLADIKANPDAYSYWFHLYMTEHLPVVRAGL
ncbi:isopentenyl-diphosphate Delta-isomerase [Rhodocista pekingensis]|uniref:Isopentenyl-diphosphate Delta-isomerase n=1 Tax=Rhodocista pekingensis TaxID=201185 RepID=A0ABW2KX00_9PROT